MAELSDAVLGLIIAAIVSILSLTIKNLHCVDSSRKQMKQPLQPASAGAWDPAFDETFW